MEKVFILILSACVALFVAELLFFIAKAIVFIAYAIVKKDAKVNFVNNIVIISILSFIITFFTINYLIL